MKGFTDTLRVELAHERAPVSVTLIKPGSIDTPIVGHAKNYLRERSRLPPPAYAPDLVAAAILHAAEHPTRDLYVGAFARIASPGTMLAPRLSDRIIASFGYRGMRTGEPASERANDLEQSQSGAYSAGALRTSLLPVAARTAGCGGGRLAHALTRAQARRSCRTVRAASGSVSASVAKCVSASRCSTGTRPCRP